MVTLAALVGTQIEGGWRIERWYEIKTPWPNRNKNGSNLEYFTNLEAAQVAGIMADKNENDVEPREIIVMTQDGKTGIPLSNEIKASPRSLVEVRDEKKKKVLGNLSVRARELLNPQNGQNGQNGKS